MFRFSSSWNEFYDLAVFQCELVDGTRAMLRSRAEKPAACSLPTTNGIFNGFDASFRSTTSSRRPAIGCPDVARRQASHRTRRRTPPVLCGGSAARRPPKRNSCQKGDILAKLEPKSEELNMPDKKLVGENYS